MIDPDNTPDDIRFRKAIEAELENGTVAYAQMMDRTEAERDHYYVTGEAQPFIDALAQGTT